MKWAWLVFALGACRLGFDATSRDGLDPDGGPDSTNEPNLDASSDASGDAPPAVCPDGFTSWSSPITKSGLQTSDNDESPGWVSPTRILLASDRGDSIGGRDLFDARADIAGGDFTSTTAIAAANSIFDDVDPHLVDQTLYFASDRSGQFQIFELTADTVTARPELGTNATDPHVTPDQLEILYSRDGTIHHATRATPGQAWTALGPVTSLSSVGTQVMPTLAPNALSIYFVRDLGTGARIWFAQRPQRTDSFAFEIEVSEFMDSTSDTDPSLSDDGLTLYFSANRPGANLADLYISTRSCL